MILGVNNFILVTKQAYIMNYGNSFNQKKKLKIRKKLIFFIFQNQTQDSFFRPNEGCRNKNKEKRRSIGEDMDDFVFCNIREQKITLYKN